MRLFILILLTLNITIYSQEQPQQNPKEDVAKKIDANSVEKGDDVDEEKNNKNLEAHENNKGEDREKKDEQVDNNKSDEKNKGANREENDEQQVEVKEKPKPQRHRIIVIGKLVKTKPLTMKKPSEYVLEDDMLYKGADYYVGDLYIHSTKKRDLSDLENRVVMVHGYLEKDLNKVLEVIGECPENYGEQESMQQIRSDWVDDETGYSIGHSSTEALKQVSYVRYYKIQKCKGFRAKKYLDSKKVEIIFHNHLRKSISDLKLVAHYESVFGKPVPMYQDKKIASLSPGEKASFVIPMTIASIKKYRLHAVKACADANDLHIDINEIIENE
ncbi:hypothetical protein [Candidatus Uabimicrobium amorphum]|uniref:Uncharacterized protein n=1 Tax=Uabimicrobium amorphum TaxID=2596890 RepID=A0A5S9IJX6_UABAM|nr:hypothetical protein [Candidatus Uabimicrobium amorphum]BBM82751.1 hypothetical protein UABAM_01094 [Candidatus Uabimicrobium amorphum]